MKKNKKENFKKEEFESTNPEYLSTESENAYVSSEADHEEFLYPPVYFQEKESKIENNSEIESEPLNDYEIKKAEKQKIPEEDFPTIELQPELPPPSPQTPPAKRIFYKGKNIIEWRD